MQPVKDNLGRSDVAFARNGFTEGAQNGQRVGMRSPVGAPDNWAVRDVLTKERVQMGPIVLMLSLDPRLSAVSTQPQTHAVSRWRHPRQCRRYPRPR